MPNKPVVAAIPKPWQELDLACAECGTETSHKALAGVNESGQSPDDDITYWMEYWTVQCQGCKTVSFCRATTTTEDVDDEGVPIATYDLYPARLNGHKKMSWDGPMPHEIYRIYEETHAAICQGSAVLSGIGIRAVVEAVCKNQGVNGKLNKQIDKLAAKNIITAKHAKTLHRLRFMGNDAAHDVKAHKPKELSAGIKVVEHLLHSVYGVDKIADGLPRLPTARQTAVTQTAVIQPAAKPAAPQQIASNKSSN